MSAASEALREFHLAFDVPHGSPTLAELARRRVRLHNEEHHELREALGRYVHGSRGPGRLEGLARELADVMVVAYGTADLFGIDLDAAFEAVMAANMAKLPDCPECHGTGKMREVDLRGMSELQADLALQAAQAAGNPTCSYCHGTGKGKPIKRDDGKVLKPKGWQEPSMAEAIRRSYPDAVTDPADAPTVSGTEVTRPL